jgi:hypothetical protein
MIYKVVILSSSCVIIMDIFFVSMGGEKGKIESFKQSMHVWGGGGNGPNSKTLNLTLLKCRVNMASHQTSLGNPKP